MRIYKAHKTIIKSTATGHEKIKLFWGVHFRNGLSMGVFKNEK